MPHSPRYDWYKKLEVKTFYMSNVTAIPKPMNFLCNVSNFHLQF